MSRLMSHTSEAMPHPSHYAPVAMITGMPTGLGRQSGSLQTGCLQSKLGATVASSFNYKQGSRLPDYCSAHMHY